jgi:hypothetical protein
MVRVDSSGAETAVTATIESATTQTATISDSTVTAVTYRFAVDGTVITTGQGTLQVGVAIDEVGTGGSTSAGGATSTGGSTATGGTTATTGYTETSTFTSSTGNWVLNSGSASGAAFVAGSTVSPAGSAICASGCGLVTVTMPAGAAAWSWAGGATLDEFFPTEVNLTGKTVTAQVALEMSGSASAVVQLFSQGGSSTTWAWGTTAIASSSTLTDVTKFHAITLNPVDSTTGAYRAATTGILGLQVVPDTAVTTATVVKLYIKSITVN